MNSESAHIIRRKIKGKKKKHSGTASNLISPFLASPSFSTRKRDKKKKAPKIRFCLSLIISFFSSPSHPSVSHVYKTNKRAPRHPCSTRKITLIVPPSSDFLFCQWRSQRFFSCQQTPLSPPYANVHVDPGLNNEHRWPPWHSSTVLQSTRTDPRLRRKSRSRSFRQRVWVAERYRGHQHHQQYQ